MLLKMSSSSLTDTVVFPVAKLGIFDKNEWYHSNETFYPLMLTYSCVYFLGTSVSSYIPTEQLPKSENLHYII